jgi:Zn-dependent peptidase ImmA (M78 family)
MNPETDTTELQPKVLRWARKRVGLSPEDLARKLAVEPEKITEWEETGRISFPEVERLADKTYTPIGFLFLKKPPKETLPVSDFRHVGSIGATKPPSPDLLDVFHNAQLRQNWYREYLIANGEKPLSFVGKATLQTPPKNTAADIRDTLGIGTPIEGTHATWEDALRHMIEALEDKGILVLRTGYAGGYTHRKLSVDEFRGFALADEYAPLVFINGADAPTAQMFTLAHEVAHIWLGESAVFNLEQTYPGGSNIESYCNQVAAEVLVPTDDIKLSWNRSRGHEAEIERLSKKYAVSRIVVARRARDAGFITKDQYSSFFGREMRLAQRSKGGNYYLNTQYQNSRRFSVALLRDARTGNTLYHDAMHLLGIKKQATFRKYAESLQMEW